MKISNMGWVQRCSGNASDFGRFKLGWVPSCFPPRVMAVIPSCIGENCFPSNRELPSPDSNLSRGEHGFKWGTQSASLERFS